jgi:fimbrial isopeptide formation D2 family protein
LYWYDSCGNQQSFINNSCQNYYSNGSLNVTKTVRNLTSGSGWSNSTYANPSDTVMFMITVQATGNQNVQNVFVRDTLPANLIYNNQLVVACSGNNTGYNNCNSNNYNYSGSVTSGIGLNTMYAGQTVTITYQAQLAPVANLAYGTTTLNNNVYVTSSNASSPSARASVIVTRSTVLGASTVSTGLTNNVWVDSFLLPLLIALAGVWMWRSGMFFGVEKWIGNKKKIRDGYKSERELIKKIAKIQKFGKA